MVGVKFLLRHGCLCYTKAEDRYFPKKEVKCWGSEKLIPAKITSPNIYRSRDERLEPDVAIAMRFSSITLLTYAVFESLGGDRCLWTHRNLVMRQLCECVDCASPLFP